MQSHIKLSLTALGHSYIWRIQLRIPSLDSELQLQPRTHTVFVLYSCSGKLAEDSTKKELPAVVTCVSLMVFPKSVPSAPAPDLTHCSNWEVASDPWGKLLPQAEGNSRWKL